MKSLPVFSADALIEPHAVMVVLLHTALAVAAVFGTNGTHCLAGVADVEDGVVVVTIVPPGRGIANLEEKRYFM